MRSLTFKELHWSKTWHHKVTELFFPSGVSCQKLTPVKTEESSLEDSTVTLSYTYSKQATGSDEFYWYRQYPGKPPEFLLYHSASGNILNQRTSGLKIKVEKTQINMSISSAAVTDSAVYYCAVRPTVTGNSKTLYKNTSWHTDKLLEAFFPHCCSELFTSTRGPHYQVGGALLLHCVQPLCQ